MEGFLMKWFNNLKIGPKLIIAFLIIALIAAVVGIVGLMNLNKIDTADTLLYEDNTLSIAYSGNAAAYYQRLKYHIAECIIKKDDSLTDNYVTNINSDISSIDEQLKLYEEGIIDEEDRKEFDELKHLWEQYKSYTQEIIKYIREGQYDKAEKVLTEESAVIGESVRDNLFDLVEYNQIKAAERETSNDQIATNARTLMITIIIIGVILAVVLGFIISRSISKPIGMIVDAANKLAAGDIEIQSTIYQKDEIGQLAESFRNLVKNTQAQVAVVERIADGDLTVDVPIRSEKDVMGTNSPKWCAISMT